LKPKFAVNLTHRFSRDIKALDRNEQVRILRQVYVLETNPHAGKPLHGEFTGVYSLRIGNFRVLYRIEGNQVLLLAVGHRKQIYG
jgi:mRNA interferase RelE/StbE